MDREELKTMDGVCNPSDRVLFYRGNGGYSTTLGALFSYATAQPQLSELDQAYLEYGRTVFHSPGGSLGKAAVEPCKRIWELLEVQPNGDKIENKVDGSVLNTAEIENIRSWNHNNPTIGGLVASHEALRKKEPELTPLQAKKIELADFAISGGCDAPVHLVQEIKAMIAAETPTPSLAERARKILVKTANIVDSERWSDVVDLLNDIAKETE